MQIHPPATVAAVGIPLDPFVLPTAGRAAGTPAQGVGSLLMEAQDLDDDRTEEDDVDDGIGPVHRVVGNER